MSDNNLDNALKMHFAKRENVPQSVKNVLHIKFHAAENAKNCKQKKENLRWLWMLVPCALLFATALLLFANAIFGTLAVVVLGIMYHVLAVFGATAILFALLGKSVVIRQKNNRKEVFS